MRDVSAEVGQQRFAVAALGSRRKADQEVRLEALDDGLVRRRWEVMALVDYDMAKMSRAHASNQSPGQDALNGRKEVLVSLGPFTVGQELTERAILERVPEGVARLEEDFLAVR